MPRICVFHHVPKTAGSALRAVLESNYPGKRYVNHYDGKKKSVAFYRDWVRKLPRRGPLCVASHGAGFLVPVLVEKGADFRAVTILRDPVERVVSTYYYVLTIPAEHTGRGRRVADVIRRDELSLVDIYDRFAGAAVHESDERADFQIFFDFQTRSLLAPWEDVGDQRYGEPFDESALDRTRRRLAEHYEVGVQERFGEAVRRFARVFGWRVPDDVATRRINVGRERPRAIDATLRETILRHNRSDAALHASASDM